MTSVRIGPRCSFGVGFRVWGTRAACPGGLVSPRPKVTEGAQKVHEGRRGTHHSLMCCGGAPLVGALPRPCVALAPGPSGFHLTLIHIHVYKTHGHSSPAAAGSTSRSCRAMQGHAGHAEHACPPQPRTKLPGRVSARLRQLPARTHTYLVCGTRTVRYGPWPGQTTRLAAPECARSCHL